MKTLTRWPWFGRSRDVASDQTSRSWPVVEWCVRALVLVVTFVALPVVVSANTPPVNTVPELQSVYTNTAVVFSSGNGNQISITDADAAGANNQITLSATNGTVSLSGTAGLTFTVGDGTADATMTLRGTAAAINTALNGLHFTPSAGFTGTATLTLATKDSVLLSLDIDATLKGHYTFENTGALGADTSPAAGFPGTPSGASTSNDSTRGHVLSLAGAGYIQTTGHFASPTNVTLAAWVNLTTADTSGAEVISLGDSVSLRLDQSGTSPALAGAFYTGSSYVTTTYTRTLAGTGWHHVAYAFDNTNNLATLYLDGAAVATTSTTASIAYTLGPNSFIGKHGNGSTAFDFNGKIDEARVYSRALTANEIATLAADLSMTDTDTVAIAITAPPGAVQYGTSASATANSANTITLSSFTAIAGTSRIIVVGLAFGQGAPTGVSVAYGGHAFTLASGTTATSGNASVQIWYLTDPNTGPFNIVASWTGSHDVVIGAVQFANVNQGTPISNGTVATGSSTSPSVTVASTSGKMTFSTVSTLGVLSAPTQTQRWLVTTPTTMDGGGSTAAGDVTVTHAWTSTSAAWAAAVVNINPITTTNFQVGSFTKPTTAATAVSYQSSATGVSNSAATITLASFNPGSGANRLLVVGLSTAGSAPSGVSIAYGGVRLTLAPGTSGTSGSSVHTEIWYLINPSSTAANIVATWTTARKVVIGAVAFNNVDQTTPIENGTFATGTSITAAVTIASNPNDMTFDTVTSLAETMSAPTRASHWSDSSLSLFAGSGSTASGAATVAHQWTNSSSVAWVDAGLSIRHNPIRLAIPHGLGQTPKALILWTSGDTNTDPTADFNLSMGFSDGSSSGSTAAASQYGQAPSVAARRMANKAITIIDPSQLLLAEADLGSWDSTNFTLNWTANDANGYIIHFIAISGADVQASVVNWAAPTAIGNKAVTGVGFKPTVVLHLHAGGVTTALPTSSSNAGFGLGMMDYSGHEWATDLFSVNASTSSDTQRGQQTNAAILGITATPSVNKKASWVSMDADGFTVNFSVVSTADQNISLALSGLNAWVGSFNKTTGASNSTQATTGLGFLPQALLLASSQDITRASPEADSRLGFGASDGNNEASSLVGDANGLTSTSAGSSDSTTTAFAKANSNAGNLEAIATVNSFDADGFTLKWPLNDAVATEMLYLALGPLINTEVRLITATATQYPQGTLVQWRTGYEINNLGFNVYRAIGGVKTKVNATLVAGSALQAGPGTAVTTPLAYALWDQDAAAQTAGVTYWLEDVDLNGTSTMHGPYTPVLAGLQVPLPVVTPSASLTGLGLRGTGTVLMSQTGIVTRLPAGAVPLPPTTAARQTQWDVAGQAAIRIGIDHVGWYRVPQPALVAAGWNPTTDPRTLKLFVDGTEQALWVTGNASGQLAADGAIEFYGTGLDTPFTDTRIYWLTSGGAAGRRIAVAPADGSAAVAPGRFWSTVTRKDRSVYFAALTNGEAENWFGPLISTTPVTVTLPADHLDGTAGSAAQVEVTLQGVTIAAGLAANHRVGVLVNGTDVGEVLFSAQDHPVERLVVPPGVVVVGDNVVTLVARGGDLDTSLLDTVRLSYWHTTDADADQLAFTQAVAGVVTIGGFSSAAIRAVDITDPAQVVALTGTMTVGPDGSAAVTVRTTGDGPRTLLAFADQTTAAPKFVAAHVGSHWHENQAHNYVVIAHSSLIAAVAPLVALRTTQGYQPAVIDVQALYDEFSFGAKTPHALRDFLTWAKQSWRTPPRFVVLVGDATIDPRDYAGLGDFDLVPTQTVALAALSLETASDDWFVDANDDGLPDVAIGRLSARTLDQAHAIVAKIVAYDSVPAAPWTKSVLLVADEDDSDSSFERDTSQLASLVPAPYQVQRVSRTTQTGPAAHAALADAVAAGQLLVNYTGHGSVQVWGREGDILTNADVATWTNGSRLPLVIAMDCLTGYFTQIFDEESLGEALQRQPGGGAIAVWGSSGLTPPATQTLVAAELFRLIFAGTYATVGEAVAAAKRVVANPDLRRSWIFFGDPAMQLAGAPRPVGVSPPLPTDPGAVALGVTAPVAPPRAVPVLVASNPAALHLADWNGDGRADVLVAATTVERAARATGSTAVVATGTVWRATLSMPGGGTVVRDGRWDAAWEAYPAHLTGALAADLVLFDRATGTWAQARNDGGLAFTYTTGTWGVEWTVQVADLNGDGIDDVLLTNPETGVWFTALTTAAGGFSYQSGQWPLDAVATLGAFTGTGRADAWLYNAATGLWWLQVSDGDGGFTTAASGQWTPGWALQAAHVTGLTPVDLLLYNASTGAWATTTAAQTGATAGGPTGSLQLGDPVWAPGLTVQALPAAPGSTDPDELLLYDPTTGQATVLTSQAGVRTAAGATWLPGRTLATGDLDGDGRTDVVLFDQTTGTWVRVIRPPLAGLASVGRTVAATTGYSANAVTNINQVTGTTALTAANGFIVAPAVIAASGSSRSNASNTGNGMSQPLVATAAVVTAPVPSSTPASKPSSRPLSAQSFAPVLAPASGGVLAGGSALVGDAALAGGGFSSRAAVAGGGAPIDSASLADGHAGGSGPVGGGLSGGTGVGTGTGLPAESGGSSSGLSGNGTRTGDGIATGVAAAFAALPTASAPAVGPVAVPVTAPLTAAMPAATSASPPTPLAAASAPITANGVSGAWSPAAGNASAPVTAGSRGDSPSADASQPAPASPSSVSETVRPVASSQPGSDRTTYLLVVRVGENEIVRGGQIAEGVTAATIAVRQATSPVPARLSVRFRGSVDVSSTSRVAVTVNGVAIGDVATRSSDAAGWREWLTLPPALLVDGDNLITLHAE